MSQGYDRRTILKGVGGLGLGIAGMSAVSGSVSATPGDELGRVTLPGNLDGDDGFNCAVAGAFDGRYYATIKDDSSSCRNSILQIYRPPASGDGEATQVSEKSIVDADTGEEVLISALEYDPERDGYWGAYAGETYFIEPGDPTADTDAMASFQFDSSTAHESLEITDGLAITGDNANRLWYSEDVSTRVYLFDVTDGSVVRTITPKDDTGADAGNISGLATGTDLGGRPTLYCGRAGIGDIIRVYADDGEFISNFAEAVSERVEALACDPVTYDTEALLAKDARNDFYTAFEVETGTCPLSGGVTGDDVDVQSIDPTDYPTICANVQVTTTAGLDDELTQEDFTVYEEGEERTIEEFNIPTEEGGKVDIAFVFDDSGSMGGEIDAMKAGVNDFAQNIEDRGLDAQFGLVSFKDEVEVDQTLTADLDTFQSAVDDLFASGGADFPEDNFDAIEAALGFDYRGDAEKVVVDITDAVAHYDGDGAGFTDWTLPEMADRLLAEGVTYVAVAPSTDEAGDENNSKQVLAENVGGLFIDIRSADFGEILDEIGGSLTEGQYTVCWSTPLSPDDTRRSVVIDVEDPDEGLLRTNGRYIPPADVEPGWFSAERDAPSAVSAGGSGSVTLTVELNEAKSRMSINENFSPEFADVTLDDASIEGEGSILASGGDTDVVTAAITGAGDGTVVTLEYTVEVPADAAEGDTFDITGSLVAGEDEGTVPTDTITVGAGLAVYANEDCVIDTPGLSQAVTDWASGEITTEFLSRVVTAWASGREVC